jgi:alkylation response protein AidB-like acyl-CoA dehydrogenase
MDLKPSEEQQQLIDTFGAFYAKECPVERVRTAEPTGHDPELWGRLREMGALEMAVDEGSGGWGASLLDLALVAEQHGRHLGPAPLIESQVAARLLARVGRGAADGGPGAGAATDALGRVLREDRLVTLALHPSRNGRLTVVPAGAVADEVVFLDGDRLRCAPLAAPLGPAPNLASMPVADVEPEPAGVELASGNQAVTLFELARDEWLALMANALIGVGARSLELGVAYAKDRHAFGVPIGSFQAVAHGLADAATAVDGGTLLAREAAWAADEDPDRFRQLASFSCAFCAEAARQAAGRSLHYHGGYGFMLEFDVQLYFRRATGWPAVFGEPSAIYARGEADRLASTRGDR